MAKKDNSDAKSRGIMKSFGILKKNNDKVNSDIASSISGLPKGMTKLTQSTRDKYMTTVNSFPRRGYKDSSVDLGKMVGDDKMIDQNGQSVDFDNYLTNMLDNDANVFKASASYRETILENKVYDDYDMICRYMPQLDDCLLDFRSNILSPDENIKSTINVRAVNGSVSEEIIDERVTKLKKKYKIDKNMNQILYNTLKYGKQRVYRKDYKDIMAHILNAKNAMANGKGITESFSIKEADVVFSEREKLMLSEIYELTPTTLDEKGKVLQEGAADVKDNTVEKQMAKNIVNIANDMFTIGENMLDSVVRDVKRLAQANLIDIEAIASTYLSEGASNEEKKQAKTDIDKLMNNYLSGGKKKSKDLTYSDGMLTSNKEHKPDDIKISGSLMKLLPIRNVVPLKVNELVIGYYIFEVDNATEYLDAMYRNPTDGLTLRDVNKVTNLDDDSGDNLVLKKVSDLLVKRLDKKFIEANPEFADVIYEFCKYNGVLTAGKKYKIKYIKSDDIINFEVDGGISKLDRALFPAKLYCILLISNMLAKVMRGNDKRAFYVKQGIDANVAQTMMDTIIQIKKSEFAASDITNMNRVFGLLGRFNDIFIPTSPNGDRPFEVDVIAGQDTQIKDEFLEFLERTAINVTGTPAAAVDSHSEVEYARSLSMANGKYARSILCNQTELHDPTSELFTGLYRSEYDDEESNNVELEGVYPAPRTLINQNTSEQFRTAQEMVEVILKASLGDDPDPQVYDKMYTKLMIKYGPTSIDYGEIQRMKKAVEIELAKPKDGTDDDEAGGASGRSVW